MFNELTIAKTQTIPAGNVATSSVVTYTVVVTNAGSDPAFKVKLTDTLPAGFTFISADDTAAVTDPLRFACTPGSGNTINCTGATLSGTSTRPSVSRHPGRSTSRRSRQPSRELHERLVDPDNTIPEGNETNNTAYAPTTVRVGSSSIDLRVTKTASPSVLPGSHARPTA